VILECVTYINLETGTPVAAGFMQAGGHAAAFKEALCSPLGKYSASGGVGAESRRNPGP